MTKGMLPEALTITMTAIQYQGQDCGLKKERGWRILSANATAAVESEKRFLWGETLLPTNFATTNNKNIFASILVIIDSAVAHATPSPSCSNNKQ